jgi:hypothetical protein
MISRDELYRPERNLLVRLALCGAVRSVRSLITVVPWNASPLPNHSNVSRPRLSCPGNISRESVTLTCYSRAPNPKRQDPSRGLLPVPWNLVNLDNSHRQQWCPRRNHWPLHRRLTAAAAFQLAFAATLCRRRASGSCGRLSVANHGAAESQARPLSRRHARSDSEHGRDLTDGGVADPSSCDAGSTALTHAGFRGRAACRSAEGRATGARDQLAAMCAATALQA